MSIWTSIRTALGLAEASVESILRDFHSVADRLEAHVARQGGVATEADRVIADAETEFNKVVASAQEDFDVVREEFSDVRASALAEVEKARAVAAKIRALLS